MNERIQKLVEQAGYTEGYYESDDGPFIEPEFNKEKFAELIVKECLSIAKHVNRNPYLPDGEQARQIIKDITKNFGVEE